MEEEDDVEAVGVEEVGTEGLVGLLSASLSDLLS